MPSQSLSSFSLLCFRLYMIPTPLHQSHHSSSSSLSLSLSARPTMLLFLLFVFGFSLSFSQATQHPQEPNNPLSLSFPLTSVSLSRNTAATLYPSLFTTSRRSSKPRTPSPAPLHGYKIPFKYSTVLIVSLPIGTPPQTQDMILDTGSQLSWIQCHRKPRKTPPTASFDPSLSSSFSLLPCNHPLCKPRVPDFTLPTSCDQNRLCHYSYFYADGTLAEGNLVREKFTFSSSLTTAPVILGCAQDSGENRGILGMNVGRRSFISQAKISKFSYCVPTRLSGSGVGSAPTGSFYLGNNPNSATFQYVNLLTFPESQRSPNFDPLAYTVPMQGIRIGRKRLNISSTYFRPDRTGSGQTMLDSGSDLTYLVDEAYDKVREEIVRLVGAKMKKDYVYAGVADICFDGDAAEIGRSIGDMALQFEKGVEILIPKERVVTEVEHGIKCVGIGRSERLGVASNIIGNVHQQNMWVEYDLANKRIGFGRDDCSRSMKKGV